jgi:hypothetical protein
MKGRCGVERGGKEESRGKSEVKIEGWQLRGWIE